MIVSESFNICFCRASVSLNSPIRIFLINSLLSKIIDSCFQYLFLRAAPKVRISARAEKGVLENGMLSCFSREILTGQTNCRYWFLRSRLNYLKKRTKPMMILIGIHFEDQVRERSSMLTLWRDRQHFFALSGSSWTKVWNLAMLDYR